MTPSTVHVWELVACVYMYILMVIFLYNNFISYYSLSSVYDCYQDPSCSSGAVSS